MCSYTERLRSTQGQATVEAAFLIPVMFVVLLLLIQPGILLYTSMVMQAAAHEGCRLLATRTDVSGADADVYEGYILRRLGAIPPQDNFHMHQGSCSWEIELEGDQYSENVTVTIKNRVRFLPLFDVTGSLFRLYDESGTYLQVVSATSPTQPAWVSGSEFGLNPPRWVEEPS